LNSIHTSPIREFLKNEKKMKRKGSSIPSKHKPRGKKRKIKHSKLKKMVFSFLLHGHDLESIGRGEK